MDKILYILGQDPNDKRSWSGICNSCLNQLKRYYEVETIVVLPSKFDKILYKLSRVVSKVLRKSFNYYFTLFYSKRVGKKLNSILKNKSGKDYKGIFLIGSQLGAFIQTDIPILYYTDAVFNQMIGYYDNYGGLNKDSGNEIELRTLKNSRWIMLASDWAKKCVISFYHIEPEKCFIGKFGANVDTTNFKHVHDANTRHILFVGKGWNRKGGDVAVECMRHLKYLDSSHNYLLHLVGSTPPKPITDNNIKVYGFLNRNIPEQRELMIKLREISDIFLLPTKAECAGIVFCESSAYGIPSVTYDTGGIGSYVIDGENGYKLPIGASPAEFAQRIIDIYENGELDYMRERAIKIYDDDMNWNQLGNLIHEKIG